MIIHSATRNYEVIFEESFSFIAEFKHVQNTYFVIDKNVWDLYRSEFAFIENDSLYILDAKEENKTIDTALDICKSIMEKGAKRNLTLISFGGGITQDLTGFVSNILYRGIKWIYIPTTLLAACDSCIGGKTSLNFESYKNLLGTFYPPNVIYICPRFFNTLSDPDIKSGLGEVVKFNIMNGKNSLNNLEKKLPSFLELDPTIVNEFVKSSLSFKKAIIEEDEFDSGKRVLLNFAHTFGHAFEISSDYKIPHGSAVALGLVAANSLSNKRQLLNSSLVERIEKIIDRILPKYSPEEVKDEVVLNAIKKDKKQVGNQITAVLLNSDFELSVVNDVSEEDIIYADSYVRNYLHSRVQF